MNNSVDNLLKTNFSIILNILLLLLFYVYAENIPNMGAGKWTGGPLEEQQVLLSTEASLQALLQAFWNLTFHIKLHICQRICMGKEKKTQIILSLISKFW